MRPVFVIAAAASLCAVFFASSGVAKNQYRLAAIAQYKLESDREDGTRAVACTYCHINSTGASPWNPFGVNLRDVFRNKTRLRDSSDKRIKDALFEVLKSRLDSDGDGYFDALEVYAGTLPGNKLSVPNRNVVELEKAFMASGGFAQFKAP
ncbi:MAG: thrombospondin type 3 repeat-containing protein [Deinococcales bacterium]